MDCDICNRSHDTKRLPFLCTVDARNQIYEGRIKNLHLLIENAGLQKQLSDLLADPTLPTANRKDSLQAQQRLAEDRTTQILAAADKLRDGIKAAREEIKAKKTAITRRRSDIAAVSNGLMERRAKQQKEVERTTSIFKYRWSQTAEDMSGTRAFLCREAAHLCGLKRVNKGSPDQYEYHLGGLPIVDLTDMNSLSPEVISTSLGHVTHLLMLTSHYLALRLPAALTLPHRDHPRPTIFTLSSSYKHGATSFLSQTGIANPPSDTRNPESQHIPRPRPLYVDKPLPQLAKDDPAAFSYFIEGVTLLAYDIAWACSTQGVSIGDKTYFEDICNMGRNLHNLLIDQHTSTGNTVPIPLTPKNPDAEPVNDVAQANWMGRFSHGTTFYFLGNADGTEFAKNFKLPGPMKLADRLKKKLVAEAPAPDWEVVDDDAWKIEDGPDIESNTTNDRSTEGKNSPHRGSSGWMKVKNR
ncbi:UV radiation resistance protein and autophagy-related subunit 14-domain-containing protein [Dactylonectria estremocensis]|uniref:Autophagy-related protein 14 n=1 Tax=Dactylonectria estremocensis TaxID=1079267 RepID=A0A9P9F7G5_9HYPO|nr:UV radiation resistance protein and autophagy-related subunit 14-domain-containing protein [Dactylonectria estremocensis]